MKPIYLLPFIAIAVAACGKKASETASPADQGKANAEAVKAVAAEAAKTPPPPPTVASLTPNPIAVPIVPPSPAAPIPAAGPVATPSTAPIVPPVPAAPAPAKP